MMEYKRLTVQAQNLLAAHMLRATTAIAEEPSTVHAFLPNDTAYHLLQETVEVSQLIPREHITEDDATDALRNPVPHTPLETIRSSIVEKRAPRTQTAAPKHTQTHAINKLLQSDAVCANYFMRVSLHEKDLSPELLERMQEIDQSLGEYRANNQNAQFDDILTELHLSVGNCKLLKKSINTTQ